MGEALYGDGGFYRRGRGPRGHFRTSVSGSGRFAAAVGALVRRVDRELGCPARLDVVDVGAGRGELLVGLAGGLPDELRGRVRLVGVEVADRPAGLPAAIGWEREVPAGVTGLLVANEWLDNVPFDVVELAADGPRLVEVDERGATRLGAAPAAADLAWLDAWWPLVEEGAQADLGRHRDAAWAAAVDRLAAGVAVAIDYAHVRAARPAYSTLTGYAEGRQVAPVPDGSRDLTGHVALDACAAAADAGATLLTTQRDALRQLGVTGARPPRELASDDPPGYLRRLAAAGEEGELLDRAGLGGFTWLVQARGGVPLPLS